ncbi:hypothetical protein [Reichenbachiella sp.]|uniref:hypothetical protein n=1 Tax=Reichenbachiella sp. TaxID=2184521 RepID=UPI003BAEC71E
MEIAVTVLSSLAFCYFLWDHVDFENIGFIEISLGLLILTTIFNLIRNLKLILEGENYIFNKSLNSITKNDQSLGQLHSIYNIDIIEKREHDSPTQYELQIHLRNNQLICFQKTTNLKVQKSLGFAISSISDSPFNYAIREQQREQEILKQQAINLEPYIKMFEDKFVGKSKIELESISKEDSGYAEYAQKAARNLLNRMQSTNGKTDVQQML